MNIDLPCGCKVVNMAPTDISQAYICVLVACKDHEAEAQKSSGPLSIKVSDSATTREKI